MTAPMQDLNPQDPVSAGHDRMCTSCSASERDGFLVPHPSLPVIVCMACHDRFQQVRARLLARFQTRELRVQRLLIC